MFAMHLKTPKRLTRPPKDDLPAFRLTGRDHDLVRLVNAYRFATSEQLYRFLSIENPSTSRQKVRRRLQALHAHRFLNRPAHQYVQLGSLASLVYSLGSQGLHLLGESAEVSDARALWAAKASHTASPLFLNHALAVTDCMLAFARDCAARTGTRLVDQPELIAAFPAETQALAHPLRLRVSVKRAAETISLCVVPDRLFAIDAPDGRRVFSLELDTGSMSISARRLTKSSFGKKITGYLAAYDQQRYRTQFGTARLRILTVTTTDARIRAMLEAQHAISGGRLSSMFLFTTFTKLAAHGPLAPIWIANGNDAISLLPET